MRPIPRALLIHSATLFKAEADAYGNETLTTLAELARVRVEPDDTHTLGRKETRAEPSALLLYDARNSKPKSVAFSTGQRVRVSDILYRVETVELLYDGRRLHHVEVTLRG